MGKIQYALGHFSVLTFPSDPSLNDSLIIWPSISISPMNCVSGLIDDGLSSVSGLIDDGHKNKKGKGTKIV